jgi:hypothetical protein
MISLALSAAISGAVTALGGDPADRARREALDDLAIRASSGDAAALAKILTLLTDVIADHQADLHARTVTQLAMDALCTSGTGRSDEGPAAVGSVARAWPALVPRSA